MAEHRSIGVATLRCGWGRRGWTSMGGHICGTISCSPSAPRSARRVLGLCRLHQQRREQSRGATLSLHPDRGPVSPETTTFGLETWFQEQARG